MGVDVDQIENFMRRPRLVEIEDSDNDDEADKRRAQSRCAELERENAELKKNLGNARRQIRRLQHVGDNDPVHDQLALLLFRDVDKTHFTPRNGMALAARRLSSGLSARRCGIAFHLDVHHTTVIRWEIIFVAAIQASRKAWYQEQERIRWGNASHLHTPLPVVALPPRVFRFVRHLVRGDATNTMRYKKIPHCGGQERLLRHHNHEHHVMG